MRMYTPSENRKTAMNGSATSAERLERNTAPAKAPAKPGKVMRATVRHSTLPKRQWAAPDASVVPSSAMWTLADTTAGAKPAVRRTVVEVTP